MTSFDTIIVGAGSAGCVLAARLSAAGHRVLLLEAGGSHRRKVIDVPLAWFQAFTTAELGWGYFSEPEPFADNRRIPAPRGKVLGGCSSVNGMMYSRGHRADYDRWAAMGLRGWSFDEVLPYFKRSEANWRGETPWHGGAGPMAVTGQSDDATTPALIETAKKLGHHRLEDFHGAADEGFCIPDFTINRGMRASTARSFLDPAMARPNLTVEAGALTTRVVIKSGRAVRVDYLCDGEVRRATAEREVILAAGAFNSPQLLLLSGIGPADELRDVGVVPVHHLPGVGRNLQDHAAERMLFSASGPITFDPQLRLDRMALAALRWQLFGSGPLGRLPLAIQGMIRSQPGLAAPDLQTLVSPVAFDSKIWFPGWRKSRGDVFTVSNVLLRPESRGWVKLRSADAKDPPRIQFNLLQAEADRAAFRRYLRMTRAFFATQPAADLIRAELQPGSTVRTDAEIDAFVRATIGTAMHPTSTCAMGIGPDAVLDEQMRVRGVAGLRVVDASAMPSIVGGNTNAPVIMMAEKAADMILGVATAAAVTPVLKES